MSIQSTTDLELPAAPAGAPTSRASEVSARDRAHRQPIAARLGERPGRGVRETLLFAAAAVAASLVIALGGAVALIAVALAGPFFLSAILALAFVLVVLGAIGTAG